MKIYLKSFRRFSQLDKKYIIGLNLYENPNFIFLSMIDYHGKVIGKEKIYCESLNFQDERYLSAKRQVKLRETCKIFYCLYAVQREKLFNLFSIKEVGMISVNDNLKDEINILQQICIDNKICLYLNNYSLSLNECPSFMKSFIAYPCINLILKQNVSDFYFNENKQRKYVFGTTNISIALAFREIEIFLDIFKLKYNKLSFIKEDKQDITATDKIINFFDKFYQKKSIDESITITTFFEEFICFLNNNHEINTNLNSPKDEMFYSDFKIPFNNMDNLIYISRLKCIFNEAVYLIPYSKTLEIKHNLNLNEILFYLKTYLEAFITLVNYNLFSHLLLFQKNKINVNTIVRYFFIIEFNRRFIQ